MNKSLGKGPIIYECNHCHRLVWAKSDGYLPIHRHKGKRNRCVGSESSTKLHKES